MNIKKLNENLSNMLEQDNQPNEVRTPDEDDLDNLYDAMNYLGDAVYFCDTQEDIDKLYDAKNILETIYNKYI